MGALTEMKMPRRSIPGKMLALCGGSLPVIGYNPNRCDHGCIMLEADAKRPFIRFQSHGMMAGMLCSTPSMRRSIAASTNITVSAIFRDRFMYHVC
jgi:hypothetical protein